MVAADTDRTRARALALVRYLQQIVQLRSKRVTDLSEYEQNILLANFPSEPEVRVSILSGADAVEPWLLVRRPARMPAPALPEALIGWVDELAVRDPHGSPELREEADVLEQVNEPGGERTQQRVRRRLENSPGVATAWSSYQVTWMAWAGEARRLSGVYGLYSQLFEMAQRSRQLGEQYETVLAAGLLSWLVGGDRARRHLITMGVTVRLDELTGDVFVEQAESATHGVLEEDMVDGTHLPSRELTDSISAALKDAGAGLWDGDFLATQLSRWVHAAQNQGRYEGSLALPPPPGEAPVVHLAPVLILRRRSKRSLLAAFQTIEASLEADGPLELPPALRAMVESVEIDDVTASSNPGLLAAQETYFPLPTNDEQRRVVEQLKKRSGVVVQGPPGTGKSHTIANLVSHLLAAGQRVLVTSETAQALEVLREKIPAGFRELCVSVIGEGKEGGQDLARSLGAMDQRAGDPEWEAEAIDARLIELQQRLSATRADVHTLLVEQRRIRELETQVQDFGIGGFQGTPARIAEQIAADVATFSWLRDAPEGTCPLSSKEARELRDLLRDLGTDDVAAAGLRTANPEQVPTPSGFEALVDTERSFDALAAELAGLPELFRLAAPTCRPAELRSLLGCARAVGTALTNIGASGWAAQMAADVLANRGGAANALSDATERALALTPPDLAALDAAPLAGVEGIAPAELDAQIAGLRAHLLAGGALRGALGRRPAPVRQASEMLENVTIAGSAPDTLTELDLLETALRAHRQLAALDQQWSHVTAVPTGTLTLRRAGYQDLETQLRKVRSLAGLRDALREAALAVPVVSDADWNVPASLLGFTRTIEVLLAVADQREATNALWQALLGVQAVATAPGAHPLCQTLLHAAEARDLGGYREAHTQLDELWALQSRVRRRADLQETAEQHAPLLLLDLQSDPGAVEWDERLTQLEPAWEHARAMQAIRDLTDGSHAQRVADQLVAREESERKIIGQIGENLAWKSALGRISQKEREHLGAYQKALVRYGAGKGKTAGSNLAAAQRNLSEGVGAVPVWIMPQYRVADTVPIELGAFDVIIVDEASQSGIESLFLLWLAPKVIVVGDDRQISPENVGITREDVERFQNEYLADIPLRDLLGIDNSLFDQAQVRYKPPVWLREHFRCMPEIIEFSNRLSYPDQRLEAMRQFGDDRLPPLQHVYVEGASETLGGVNEREAKAIVEKMWELCADPAYAGKTMGVVTLLGSSQAKRIRSLLLDLVGVEEILKRKIKVGDAYDFQGDERHVMFASLVASPDRGGRRLTKISQAKDQRRFNVAASRAQDQMWLFHSVTLADLNPDCLRAALLRHFIDTPPAGDVGVIPALVRPDVLVDPFESLFEQRVFLKIREAGYRVVPQWKTNNYRIDLVVVGDSKRLAVECDGDFWHGPDRYTHDMGRQRDLMRCGWQFCRVTESVFYLDQDAALAPLWRQLAERGIYPEVWSPPVQAEPAPIQPQFVAAEPPAIAASLPERDWSLDVAQDESERTEPAVLLLKASAAAALVEIPTTATHRPTVDGEAPARAESTFLVAPAVKASVPGQVSPAREPPLPEPFSSSASRLYRVWLPTQPIEDPRTASPAALKAALLSVVAAEGPMVAERAYRLIVVAAGGQRLAKTARSALNRATASAVRQNFVLAENPAAEAGLIHQILRLPDQPSVELRPRGPRDLEEVPLTELAAAALEIKSRSAVLSREELMRAILRRYDMVKLTSGVAAHLDKAIDLNV